MKLSFKAKNIRALEKSTGESFFTILSRFEALSTNDIAMILVGGGMTDDEADDYIDEHGIDEAMVLAGEGLKDAGFLPKVFRENMAKGLSSMKGLMKSASQLIEEDSSNSGKKEKSPRSKSA